MTATMSLPVFEKATVRPNTTEILPLTEYDIIIVSFSGGKDSIDLVLSLIDMGVPLHKIQLWHQDVDGHGERFMDWACTPAYCRAVAKALGVRILFQWKEGGFLREMLRKDALTAPVHFECQDGTIRTVGGIRGKQSTRHKFPQVSMDLSVRWCSAYLKIDVASMAINNDPALKNAKILFLSGERRQEGSIDKHGNPRGRAAYPEKEEHRCSNKKRRVDQWRLVIDHNEEQVWDIMRRHGIIPHPAYRIGFGRVSCMTCIFGLPDQWASIRHIDPERFGRILCYERVFGCTIKQGGDVEWQANKGSIYAQCNDAELVSLALSEDYPESLVRTDNWALPAGAFKRGGGPG